MVRTNLLRNDMRVKPIGVEVVKETSKFLVRPGGSKEAKSTHYRDYFSTEREAWQAQKLLTEARLRLLLHKVEATHANLIAAELRLQEIDDESSD